MLEIVGSWPCAPMGCAWGKGVARRVCQDGLKIPEVKLFFYITKLQVF
jgi:hypothetical protein